MLKLKGSLESLRLNHIGTCIYFCCEKKWVGGGLDIKEDCREEIDDA